VIEAQVDRRGPTATVIVQMGTLKVGDPFICGHYGGKVKRMNDMAGRLIAGRPLLQGSRFYWSAGCGRRVSGDGMGAPRLGAVGEERLVTKWTEN
jgi:hypothetical protein